MNSLPACSSYEAWKQAEAEAADAEAVLRLAFIKHMEGLADAPSGELQETALQARLREQRAMCAALRCRSHAAESVKGLALRQASVPAPSVRTDAAPFG